MASKLAYKANAMFNILMIRALNHHIKHILPENGCYRPPATDSD